MTLETTGVKDINIIYGHPTLNKNNIRLQVIGDRQMLPDFAQTELEEALALTAANTGLTLIMALSYSSRWEITNAVKQIALDVQAGSLDPQLITQDTFADYLCTKGIPDPALVIRTKSNPAVLSAKCEATTHFGRGRLPVLAYFSVRVLRSCR